MTATRFQIQDPTPLRDSFSTPQRSTATASEAALLRSPILRAAIRIGLLEIQVESLNLRDLWREVANLEALPQTCGLCGSIDLIPAYRRVQDFEFFSLACRPCGGHLKLGQRKDGGLFPKNHLGWFPAHP